MKANCTVRPCVKKPHTTKRCEKCWHYVAHHWNYRYCQECDEKDAQYSDGSFCDRKANS